MEGKGYRKPHVEEENRHGQSSGVQAHGSPPPPPLYVSPSSLFSKPEPPTFIYLPFLYKTNSFLTSWDWKPDAPVGDPVMMVFDPVSFYSFDLFHKPGGVGGEEESGLDEDATNSTHDIPGGSGLGGEGAEDSKVSFVGLDDDATTSTHGIPGGSGLGGEGEEDSEVAFVGSRRWLQVEEEEKKKQSRSLGFGGITPKIH